MNHVSRPSEHSRARGEKTPKMIRWDQRLRGHAAQMKGAYPVGTVSSRTYALQMAENIRF